MPPLPDGSPLPDPEPLLDEEPEDEEEAAVVVKNGLELSPPAAVARSKVAVPIRSCWVIVADLLSELRAGPLR